MPPPECAATAAGVSLGAVSDWCVATSKVDGNCLFSSLALTEAARRAAASDDRVMLTSRRVTAATPAIRAAVVAWWADRLDADVTPFLPPDIVAHAADAGADISSGRKYLAFAEGDAWSAEEYLDDHASDGAWGNVTDVVAYAALHPAVRVVVVQTTQVVAGGGAEAASPVAASPAPPTSSSSSSKKPVAAPLRRPSPPLPRPAAPPSPRRRVSPSPPRGGTGSSKLPRRASPLPSSFAPVDSDHSDGDSAVYAYSDGGSVSGTPVSLVGGGGRGDVTGAAPLPVFTVLGGGDACVFLLCDISGHYVPLFSAAKVAAGNAGPSRATWRFPTARPLLKYLRDHELTL